MPLKIPTVAGQFSSFTPMGSNSGVMAMPMRESTDFSLFSLPKLPSTPMELTKLRTITTTTMALPARITKPWRRCQVLSRMPRRAGTRELGSSRIKGVMSRLISRRLTAKPVATASSMPSRYRANTTFCPWAGKNTVAKRIYTVKRAPQDMNGAIRVVSRRSLLLSRVRADITAGTLQPKPTTRGTKDLPGRPRPRISRSMIKAARAIYPEPSRNDWNKNSVPITGIKLATSCTPPPTPSATRPISQRGRPASRSEEHTSELPSRENLVCGRPCTTLLPYTTPFRSFAGQAEAAHQPVHDKGGAGHLPGAFEKRLEQKQCADHRDKTRHQLHAAADPIRHQGDQPAGQAGI